MELFVGKIIKIPNEYTVLVNAGDDCEFIEEGDTLEIYEQGYDVIDPDSGENLGTYDYVKDEVIIEKIYEKYSVCRKTKSITKNRLQFALSPNLVEEITTYEKLNVDENQIEKERLNPKNTKIVIGDLVRLK